MRRLAICIWMAALGRYAHGGPPQDLYFHADELFSVMTLSDAAGAGVERYELGDHGRRLDPATLVPAGGSAFGNALHFTGRRHDGETDWYQFRTRQLDPVAARFTTRDTIGVWGDGANAGNAYAYVGGNPASRLDPLGAADELENEVARDAAARDARQRQKEAEANGPGGCCGLIELKSGARLAEPVPLVIAGVAWAEGEKCAERHFKLARADAFRNLPGEIPKGYRCGGACAVGKSCGPVVRKPADGPDEERVDRASGKYPGWRVCKVFLYRDYTCGCCPNAVGGAAPGANSPAGGTRTTPQPPPMTDSPNLSGLQAGAGGSECVALATPNVIGD